MTMNTPAVSLVATVLNDLEGTQKFFRAMEAQTRRPDEIVICDAGSTDGTWELLVGYMHQGTLPLVAFQDHRCKPARGRNLAVARARYDIIAITDIGCDWAPEWLEELVDPFIEDPGTETVIGSWSVRWEDQRTRWAKADYVLNHGYEFRAATSSHGTNRSVAHTKVLYHRLGGMPEDLTFAGEDSTFARLILHGANRIGAAPEPRCVWERPQSWTALMKEARRNFKADAEAGFGLKHAVLTAGRLGLECLSVLATLLLLAAQPATLLTLATVAFTTALGFWRWRSYARRRNRMIGAARTVPMMDLAALDYVRRFWSLVGYAEGLLIGRKQCLDCRTRLRTAGVGWW